MVSRWPRVVPLLALIYLPFTNGGLLTDDFAHVVHLSGIDSAQRLIDRPDAFGFYRPITQLSLAVAPGVRGERPALARAVNVALHAAVIVLSFVVASLVLQSALAAGIAALAFALTPKAAAIAVLWISARGELLMALFSLASIAAWIVWTRKGRGWWLAAAIAAYGLALLSKETATLLPLLLLLTPRSERLFAVRAGAVTGFIALALIVYAWRSQVGALTPFSSDDHYSAAISVALWSRSAINYAGRMIAAPLGLVALLALGRLIDRRVSTPADSHSHRPVRKDGPYQANVIVFAAAFVVIILAPVLPVQLRSELYLYLPVFGMCLFTGWIAGLLVRRLKWRTVIAVLAVYGVALAGYQFARARDIHQDLRFSQTFVTAIRNTAPLASTNRSVLLIPSDQVTERSLQNAIGGYLHVVLQYAFDGSPRAGTVQYSGEPPHHADVRLTCTYRQADGTVVISPER